MSKDRPAQLLDKPPSNRPVRDSSNGPATGIQTKIVGAKENTIRVSPDVGCDFITLGALVADSATGRKIDLQPATQELASLAKTHSAVVLTGFYRWPGSKGCDASILWATTGH